MKRVARSVQQTEKSTLIILIVTAKFPDIIAGYEVGASVAGMRNVCVKCYRVHN